jgi:hypothetical protein
MIEARPAISSDPRTVVPSDFIKPFSKIAFLPIPGETVSRCAENRIESSKSPFR